MGVASLQEKGRLVTPKLPFQALPSFSFPLARKDCSTRLCSTDVCFCEPGREPGLWTLFAWLLRTFLLGPPAMQEGLFLSIFPKWHSRVVFATRSGIRGGFSYAKNVFFLRAKHNAALEAIRNCHNSPEGSPRHMRAREHQDEDQVAQNGGAVCA